MAGKTLTQKEFNDLAAQVRAADVAIARRWEARVTRKKTKPVLTAGDIDFIVAPLVEQAKKNDITENQGKAIILITNASLDADPDKADPGIIQLIRYVNIWAKALRLNLVAVVTEEHLLQIADFLRDGVVRRVAFKSPGTGITYAHFDYIAVGQLVLQKEVTVFISQTGGLSEYAEARGTYLSEENMMIVNAAFPLDRRLTIVHEATHVIQDWQDVTHQAKFHEADAFIAESIVRIDLKAQPPTDKMRLVAAAAAVIILAGKARDDNADWTTAYKNVVTEVVQLYKNEGQRYDHTSGEKVSENTRLQGMLKEIRKLNEIRDVVSEEVAQILLQVLP